MYVCTHMCARLRRPVSHCVSLYLSVCVCVHTQVMHSSTHQRTQNIVMRVFVHLRRPVSLRVCVCVCVCLCVHTLP